MKKEYRIIALSCLAAFMLLWGVSAWQTIASRRVKKAKPMARKPVVKPTFRPYDTNSISIERKKTAVEISTPPNGGDPSWTELRTLATILELLRQEKTQYKTPDVFVLNSSASPDPQSKSQWIYNRKQKIIVIKSTTSQAGTGVTERRKTICRKISENLLLSLVIKKPEATLWDLGGACVVVAPNKRPRKNSKNFSKSP